MRMRVRKLIGMFGLVALAVGWPLLALLLFQARIAALSGFGQFLALVALGLVWVIPAAFLIRWMQRPDRAPR